MKYKVYHQDEHAFHVEHPDGSKFRVAKRGLSKDALKKIEAFACGGELKKYAEGGDVEDESAAYRKALSKDVGAAVDSVVPSAGDMWTGIKQSFGSLLPGGQTPAEGKGSGEIDPTLQASTDPTAGLTPQGESSIGASGDWSAPAPDAQAQLAPNPSEGATQAQAQAAPAPQDPMSNIPGYKETVAGIQGMTNAQTLAAKDQATAYQNLMDQSQKQFEQSQVARAKLDQEQADLHKAIMDQKIDPRRLLHNMSTGQKIVAAIGMALSGAGAGLAHQNNAALGMMNKFMDDDINAQKAELGKKESLYQMNLHKYRNQESADAATRLQMNTMLQAALGMSAARSGSSMAQAKAQMMLGQLKQQQIPLLNQLAMQQVEAQSLGSGTGEGGIPVNDAREGYLLKDPKYQEKRVVVNGRAYQAPDKETARNVRDVEALAGPVLDDVRKLQDIGQAALVPGTQEHNMAQAIRANLATKMPLLAGVQVGAKRLNKEEIEAQQERISDPTKFMQLLNGGIKNDEFFKSFGNELENMRQTQLIGYKGAKSVPFQSLSPGQKLPLNGKK